MLLCHGLFISNLNNRCGILLHELLIIETPKACQSIVYYHFSLLPDDRIYCWGFHTLCLWDKELNQASTELNTSFLMATFGSARWYYARCWRRKFIHDLIQLWPCVLQYGSVKQDRPAVAVMIITNHTLTLFETCSTERKSDLVL